MNTSSRLLATIGCMALLGGGVALAQQQASVDINKISASGIGEKIGTIKLTEGAKGVTLAVALTGIPAGSHGFHLHEKGSCEAAEKDGKPQAGLGAGPHFDPAGAKSHKGPQGSGHKGDLPLLKADAKGVNQTVTAPRLKLADFKGKALVIHEGGDNYTDKPENGGGAGRIACGVVPG